MRNRTLRAACALSLVLLAAPAWAQTWLDAKSPWHGAQDDDYAQPPSAVVVRPAYPGGSTFVFQDNQTIMCVPTGTGTICY